MWWSDRVVEKCAGASGSKSGPFFRRNIDFPAKSAKTDSKRSKKNGLMCEGPFFLKKKSVPEILKTDEKSPLLSESDDVTGSSSEDKSTTAGYREVTYMRRSEECFYYCS